MREQSKKDLGIGRRGGLSKVYLKVQMSRGGGEWERWEKEREREKENEGMSEGGGWDEESVPADAHVGHSCRDAVTTLIFVPPQHQQPWFNSLGLPLSLTITLISVPLLVTLSALRLQNPIQMKGYLTTAPVRMACRWEFGYRSEYIYGLKGGHMLKTQ